MSSIKSIPNTYPIRHGTWIYQYDYEVFVVYNPLDGGFTILGAVHTLKQAKMLLNKLFDDPVN